MPSLTHALDHHARDKKEIVDTLLEGWASALTPLGWQLKRWGAGHNSYRMWIPNQLPIWYFTGYAKCQVVARNAFLTRDVTERHVITSSREALAFIARVRRGATLTP